MFRVIFLFVVLGAGLFIGTQYAGQQGYVLISIANRTIEMSVTTLVIFVIALLSGLFSLEYLLKKAFYASSNTLNWFSVRKLKRSRRYTNEGIIKLLEGDWKQAEKKVTRWANHHDMPLLCYLVASEAAQGMGDRAKRDYYLDLASQQSNAGLAVELTRAKQQVREGEFEQALSTLSALQATHPNNTIVLNLLKATYVHLEQWQPLLELLPKLQKAKQINADESQQLNQKAQCGLLKNVAQQQGSEGLINHWDKLPRKTKNDVILTQCFIEQLIQRKADSQAFTVIKETLKKHPMSALYSLLAELNLPDRYPAILLLQEAISKDSGNAEAHSALAQLYMREQKWAEAQNHLEKALSLRANVSDYAYLADSLEKQNYPKAAAEVSRKALTMIEHV
ncbi:heme biosynthesis protein HemY [Vibrio sp. V01_P9A10T6]|uniref:heme biosynthesis protein HemY n=1 Tax=Vibrio sp. V01_P9A10T6 TaxID=2116368 RepID=UPI000D039FAD|nr:heme biosynthesis HemY N-terminal domain-containing protein [Vibrio sp. V01_P9A10T6]PRQ63944.1 heme biosynthesis protein HemY [Vibrio sp. V01_P9A10T6]